MLCNGMPGCLFWLNQMSVCAALRLDWRHKASSSDCGSKIVLTWRSGDDDAKAPDQSSAPAVELVSNWILGRFRSHRPATERCQIVRHSVNPSQACGELQCCSENSSYQVGQCPNLRLPKGYPHTLPNAPSRLSLIAGSPAARDCATFTSNSTSQSFASAGSTNICCTCHVALSSDTHT